jgi:hypothetical protein
METVRQRVGKSKVVDVVDVDVDDESKVAASPAQLGNFRGALARYSLWRSKDVSPPSSPLIAPTSPATVVAITSTNQEAVDLLSPGLLTSSSDDSPSYQSSTTREQLYPSPFSSPLSSDQQKHDSPFKDQYPPSLTYTNPGERPAITGTLLTPASVIYTGQPTGYTPSLLDHLSSPGVRVTLKPDFGPNATAIQPAYWATRAEKLLVLQKSLQHLRWDDAAAAMAKPITHNAGIHVFVDLSNITICFYDLLKSRRCIPANRRIPAPPFSFENFALLLERDRTVMKRVVAGSILGTKRWPAFMEEAEDCGYEMNIMQRVHKMAQPVYQTRRRNRNKLTGSDTNWTTSGGDSSDEPSTAYLRQAEQGVDEILHLKMAQSLIDYHEMPGTIVLATGDAAMAEFSDGFKSNVERALNRGWNVELHAWSSGMSSSWKDAEFSARWGKQFRIVELDGFVEELLGIWTD